MCGNGKWGNKPWRKAVGLFLCVLFMYFPAQLFAQTQEREVALLPFWGDDDEIIVEFGDELYNALIDLEGFRPVQVDMYDLPLDVPDGGFPPFVSPSPSLTGDAPFAITGSVFYNVQGQRYLRLYLWEVSGERPLFTDEMIASDREVVGLILPFMLRLLFQWIPMEGTQVFLGPLLPHPAPEPPEPVVQTIILGGERVLVYQAPPIPNRLLYVGLRLGGNVQIFDPLLDSGTVFGNAEYLDFYFRNLSAAVHLNLQLLGFQFSRFPLNPIAMFLGLQFEGIATKDFDNSAFSLMMPALFRMTVRGGTSSFSLLAGAYMFSLLWEDDPSIQFSSSIGPFDGWGFTAGLGMGSRVGPGNIFVDMRWSNDMFRSIMAWGDFRRSMISVSVGYDLGFINRRR